MRDDQDSSGRGIEETLAGRGAWYLLLRAHDHVWRDYGWSFRIRYDAATFLSRLCSEMHFDAGKQGAGDLEFSKKFRPRY